MTLLEHTPETLSREVSVLSPCHEKPQLIALAVHLKQNIQTKINTFREQGDQISILTPDWCRENTEQAGRLHADVILQTYGSTYALPNKDPLANKAAIEEGNLDVYLLVNGPNVVGTACMVNMGDGRAELGRSASLGRVGGGVILDLRILDWLTNPDTSQKYHTLFTTLRNAPDRIIEEADGSVFTMRGGQSVSAHWKKFPGVMVHGFAPLYLKHGALEQFSCASITRQELAPNVPLYIAAEQDASFIQDWHENYGLEQPIFEEYAAVTQLGFEAHYPPTESGITHLMHADIVANQNIGVDLFEMLEDVDQAGCPFTQIVLPIDVDSRSLQHELTGRGYQAFGYQPAYATQSPVLLLGKVKSGTDVVPTFWADGPDANPFWHNDSLNQHAARIANGWNRI